MFNSLSMWVRMTAGVALVLSSLGGKAADLPDLKARQLQDLEAARTGYVQASMALSADKRAQALAAIDTLRGRAGKLSDAEFTLAMARVAALADNAHDELYPNMKALGPRLPVRLVWFGDELMVTHSAPDLPELAGARVLELGGKPVAALPDMARELIGGPAQFVRANSTWLWESPALLAALGFKLDQGRVPFKFRLRDGQELERSLEPIDSAKVPHASVPELLRNVVAKPEQGEAWHSALLGAPVPMSMQEPDKRFRVVSLPRYDALYVQFRANMDRDGGRELGKFAGDTAALAMKQRPSFIVIDERFNGGGNTDLTRELMKVLAAAARVRVYILTNEYTFSAGIVSSAMAKQAAGPKARILGSTVGDRLRWWSENPSRCLPNSGHCFRPSYGLWDLQNGCAAEAGCFGDAYEVKIKHLDPDIAASLTAADWLAGYDAALMAAAADAAQAASQ